MIIAKLEDEIGLIGSIHRALRVTRFTIRTGLKLASFNLSHVRETGFGHTKEVRVNMIYFPDWTALIVSVPPKHLPIYMGRHKKGGDRQHRHCKKEKNPCRSSQISTKRKPLNVVGGNFQHPLIFLHKEKSEKMAGREI